MSTNTAFIDAIAFWSPRMTNWEAAARALRGESTLPEDAAGRPAPLLLPPNERRRAPDTVAVSLEVAARACADAGVEPGLIASVFASTHGDLAITDYMCATIAEGPESLSPTKFHNSVHNAAAGYWSIATGCMAPYTAVSAWRHAFAAGMLETLAQAHSETRPVMLVAYDIEAKGPLASLVRSDGLLACALLVAPTMGERSIARIRWRVRSADNERGTMATSTAAQSLAGNAMAACLPLLETLARGEGAEVLLSLGPCVALEMKLDSLHADRRT